MIRRAVPLILFGLLLVGSLPPLLLNALLRPGALRRPGTADGVDRRPLRARKDPLPPELVRFLEGARARTTAGEAVELMFAGPLDGYTYAYWRASYVLADRRVLPPASLLSRPSGTAIVSWGAVSPGEGWRPVWQSGEGSVWRRVR